MAGEIPTTARLTAVRWWRWAAWMLFLAEKEDKTGRRRIMIIGLMMLLLAVAINQLGRLLTSVKRSSPPLFFAKFIASA